MKMKKSIARFVFLCAAVSVASSVLSAPKKKELSAEQIAAREQRKIEFLKATGGFVGDKRGSIGKVVIMDAQTKVPSSSIKKQAKRIENMIFMNVAYVATSNKIDFASLDRELTAAGGNVTVVVVDSPVYPSLVSLPEQKCVLVNVAALQKDNPNAEKLQTRVLKEIARAVCFAFVVPYSVTPGNLMTKITSLEELDKIMVDNVTVPQLPYIDKSGAVHMGIKRYKRITYLDACQQGIAPEPANDYQKEIWKQVHEMPTEPIKIEK